MQEFTTYQKRVQEGFNIGYERGFRIGIRQAIVLAGHPMLGQPDVTTLAQLKAIDDIQTLKSLCDRLMNVSSWHELFSE
jgi:hypothetical protein